MQVSTVVGSDAASVEDVERGQVAPRGDGMRFFGSGFVSRRISYDCAALVGRLRQLWNVGSIVVGVGDRTVGFVEETREICPGSISEHDKEKGGVKVFIERFTGLSMSFSRDTPPKVVHASQL